MQKIVAVYSIAMGVVMLVLWTLFWAAGAIPEMAIRPWETAMHLTAEFTTAALLIVSGAGLWFEAVWARRINIFASGMLVYSLIQTPGRYLQENALVWAAMTAVLFIATLAITPAFKPRRPTS